MTLKDAANRARKVLPTQYCGAVIVAAGSASRMGGIDKVMAPLGGEPMILRTVRAFEDCDAIREIVLVTRSELVADMERIGFAVDAEGIRQFGDSLRAELDLV